MERVRVVVFGCLLALGLSFCPSVAYASNGFLGGLEDFVGTREVEDVDSYENDFLEEYEPEVREVRAEPVRELDEDATTVDYVNDTVDHFNSLSWGSQNFDLLNSVRIFIGSRNTPQFLAMWVLPAIGIVFLWWGVRKALKVVMGAFRKGRASI